MTKLFVLAHAQSRMHSDYFPCGTHVLHPSCPTCDANLNSWHPPLLYFWEYEFGDPQKSWDAAHDCFWGEFRLIVNQNGKAKLEASEIPFTFHATQLQEGKPLRGQPGQALFGVTLDAVVDADPIESKNTLCATCGLFTERKRQIARVCAFMRPISPKLEPSPFAKTERIARSLLLSRAVLRLPLQR